MLTATALRRAVKDWGTGRKYAVDSRNEAAVSRSGLVLGALSVFVVPDSEPALVDAHVLVTDLPWLRFSLAVISLFLVARLLQGLTLAAAALAASQKAMPYQRGQFWIRRFRKQAPALSLALAPQAAPAAAPDFVARALHMLQAVGWITAHRFLFSELRAHLLGWPDFLAPQGRRVTLSPATPSA